MIGSFCSGLLGVGGAIVTYPLLFFVPPLFGAYAMTPNEISAVTMFQVFASSGIGMLMYRKSPWLNRSVVLTIGGGMTGGSLIGSLLSGFMPGQVIHILYGCMALLAVVLMLKKRQGGTLESAEPPAHIEFKRSLAITLAVAVGLLSGIVGAGGSFLLIPIMLGILKLPTRTAIASSLIVVFLSSIGGVIGKSAGGHVHIALTAMIVAASLFGSTFGARIGQRMNVQVLRLVLVAIIFVSALNIWGELIYKWIET
nr:sulfite exporter TauE/SafE family protein [Tumebacillus amylolyticus]